MDDVSLSHLDVLRATDGSKRGTLPSVVEKPSLRPVRAGGEGGCCRPWLTQRPFDVDRMHSKHLGHGSCRSSALARDGGIICEGFDPEIDDSGRLQREGAELMVAMEAHLRATRGITTLKVRYARVFGWYNGDAPEWSARDASSA